MIGAVAGDMIGSVYEAAPLKTTDFPLFSEASRFTDDSVLTIAVARAILTDGDYQAAVYDLGRRFVQAGYGRHFLRWLLSDEPAPYYSWGNGAAMRVSPVGFAFDDYATVLREAERSAAITHNHPEGIKGAQATAAAVWMARRGEDKKTIKASLQTAFGYDLERRLEDIRPGYGFEVSCQKSVPEALLAFLASDSYETAVRLAVSLGGDSDTQACIAGGVAEAYYGGVPDFICQQVWARLPDSLAEVVKAFYETIVDA